ncbi:MAG TPA: polyphosphate kinase 1 [Firmicutes bacterium]|nr:polyphosphate kinase 1 [Bacillota bacterium]
MYMGEKKSPFTNRELSWLDFNVRVLEEAERDRNPVLERLKFLSITASNLDEFYMVRVASIKEKIQDKETEPDESGLTPEEALAKIRKKAGNFVARQYACYEKHILPDLEKAGIRLVPPDGLDENQYKAVSDYFYNMVFPVLTPIAVDKSRPLPLLLNKAVYIAVRLRRENKSYFALVQVPTVLPRHFELPCQEGRAFILLEDIITYFLSSLFELHIIEAHALFRVTRNSDLEVDEDAENLLTAMKKTLEKRKRGAPVRLELQQECDEKLREFLLEALHVSRKDVVDIPGPMALAGFMKFAMMPGGESLRLPPITPVVPADFVGVEDYFAAIREHDRFVHHPYESFDVVVDFLRQAAEDPDVLAIKQTLYRVSGQSPIIDGLIKAAQNGKQVTVLVELKARFDEANNIAWAAKLEKAGCHVLYGVEGLKTHCKILLVVRREEGGIRRYLHLGTGNYNDSTARLYTDMGMFTCREEFGRDASELFNRLTGYSRFPDYQKLVPAPESIREFVYSRIDREIEHKKKGLPAGIFIKINSLLDKGMVDRLYEASQAGVKIKLLVRGICSLVPGVKGVSENIEVRSIVGQLLEHSRIFIFENGGRREILLGSADLMPRNLNRRVELLFPVEDANLKRRLLSITELMWADNQNARVQDKNRQYKLVCPGEEEPVNSQLELARRAHAASVRRQRAVERERQSHPVEAQGQ